MPWMFLCPLSLKLSINITNSWALKHHKTTDNGSCFLSIVLNYEEEVNYLKINYFICSLMAITTGLMAINVIMNGPTHKIINSKKGKVMGEFNRNLIINGILKRF